MFGDRDNSRRSESGAPACLFSGVVRTALMGGAGRCVVSACMGCVEESGSPWGVMDGKSLGGFCPVSE